MVLILVDWAAFSRRGKVGTDWRHHNGTIDLTVLLFFVVF